jgi:hypothetical protein
MHLYHGTSPESGAALLSGAKPMSLSYRHIPGDRRAFCTSTSVQEAARFAMRKVTSLDKTGVIVVFDARKLKPGQDCATVKAASLFDEKEVAVFTPAKLKPLHLLHFDRGQWVQALSVKPSRYPATLTAGQACDFLLDRKARNGFGVLEYNEAKHIANAASLWTLKQVPLDQVLGGASFPARGGRRRRMPGFALDIGGETYDVLDGRHRIAEARYAKDSTVPLYVAAVS